MKAEHYVADTAELNGVHAARGKMPLRVEGRNESAPGILRHEFFAVSVLVILSAFVVVAPMLVMGTVSGRDFPFHLTSWLEVARQWRHGTIYPQWAELANWGFGEPRFIFYPPASWMLGAALGSLLAWKVAPIAFVWLVLIAAGISMFVLARDAMPWRGAALAAVLFAANPYHLLLVYYRSDFAELLASAFFPLLPWGVMRITRGGWRPVPVLAVVVAMIWLSNAPAAVIAMYSLAFLILVAYALGQDRRVLLFGAFAIAGGLGLAAFYILPAAHQRAWVQIKEVVGDGLRPEQNFIFSHAPNMVVTAAFTLKISCVVVLMGLVICAAAFYVRKWVAIPRAQYWLLAALAGMSFFMMLSFSRPVWVLAPELHFVQFPWRYAVPLGVAFAFFLGAAAGKYSKLAIPAVCIFVLGGPLAKIALAIEKPSSWNRADIPQYLRNIDSGIGYRGTTEYLPNGANSRVASEKAGMRAATIGRVPDSSGIANGKGGENTFRVRSGVRSGAAEGVTLDVFDYPLWHVDVEGSRVSKLRDRDGCMVAVVPAGNHAMRIFVIRQWDAKVGIALSIVTTVLLAGMTFVPRREMELEQGQQGESSVAYGFTPAVAQAPVLPMENNEHI